MKKAEKITRLGELALSYKAAYGDPYCEFCTDFLNKLKAEILELLQFCNEEFGLSLDSPDNVKVATEGYLALTDSYCTIIVRYDGTELFQLNLKGNENDN
jgi:hypothetical protein